MRHLPVTVVSDEGPDVALVSPVREVMNFTFSVFSMHSCFALYFWLDSLDTEAEAYLGTATAAPNGAFGRVWCIQITKK